MNMFTYVHHKNQPPQVAGIPTNSRFFSWNLSIDGPMLPSPPSWAGESPIQSRSSPSNLEHLPQSFLKTQAQKARTQSESVNSCQLILSNMCNRLPHHLPHRKSHQSALSVVLRSHQPRAHIRRSRPKGDDGTAYLRRSSRAAVARCSGQNPGPAKGGKDFYCQLKMFELSSKKQVHTKCIQMLNVCACVH